ncbi:MAG: 4-oxalocrotonate tautomerase [Deltaproteobacteria bacterium]|nr:4-oxalocrotonate tautomerase [Deltaproteobacteria bacterium]
MPVVHVYMFEGRTVEQRRKIVAGITQAMVDGAGTDAKEVHVLLHDMPISNWSNDGVLYAENSSYLEKRKQRLSR